MKIGILNKSKNPHPEYKTPGSSGLDLRASILKSITLQPGKRVAVPTGIYIELPNNLEAQVRPRSGLALKHGITVLNTPGTIDSDYRGEILVILINLSQEEFKINNGERIAQLVIGRVERIIWDEITLLEKTERGKGGFGSTGKV
jgi:dUTP pyrophosphatase|tara:strand:+ start:88 stop:522 length:435 start_codon:yes stop_codon:yes gene_type:complete